MVHLVVVGCITLLAGCVTGNIMKPIKNEQCVKGQKPLEVLAGPCNSEPCAVKRGAGGELSVKFVANEGSSKVFLGGQVVKNKVKPVQLPKIDLCKQGFIECPIEASHTYTLKAKGVVPNIIPPGTYEGEIWLEGDSGRIVCSKGTLIII